MHFFIPILTTHFLQVWFNWAWLCYWPNSCIILYFILLIMIQSYVIYWENWESVIWKIWVVFIGPFARAQPMCFTKWVRDASSISDLWKRFYVFVIYGPSFLLYPPSPPHLPLFFLFFFGLKHIADSRWLTLPTTTTKHSLQVPTVIRKHQPISLGPIYFQNYVKSNQSIS